MENHRKRVAEMKKLYRTKLSRLRKMEFSHGIHSDDPKSVQARKEVSATADLLIDLIGDDW